MFALNEKVVYPGHGVAIITRVIERFVSGKKMSFFELRFLHKEMTILVPVDNVFSVGIRRLSSPQNIQDVLDYLANPIGITVNEQVCVNWNKKNKDCLGKIRKGNLREISEIYRELLQVQQIKELSFGEKNLLDQTETLLVQEIAMVNNKQEQEVVEQLRSLVIRNIHRNQGVYKQLT